jgi:hypothetical protein
MSLHNIAQHMQSAGRGEDKMLVHMTPREVQGLQSLAMAHGGSLTINPKTGLPEAGILSSILPMVAGFALGPAGFGLMSAQAAGLAVGAVSTLATGSLSKGIMAGLGAYGGAGLGSALSTMGSAAAAPATSTAGSAFGATLPGAAPSALPSMIPANAAAPITGGANLSGLTQQGGFAGLQPASLANANTASMMYGNPPVTAITPPPPVNTLQQVVQPPVMQAPPVARPDSVVFKAPPPVDSTFKTADQLYAQKHPVLAGLKSATSSMDGLKTLYSTMEDENKYSGMAAGYSTLSALNQPKKLKAPKNKGLIRPYTLERKRVIDENVGPSSSAEQRYFNDVYTAQTPYAAPGPEYAAAGGVMRMADGGYVDETLNQQAVSVENNRPLPQQPAPMYMGMQQPQQNIIAQSGNTMASPGFAHGGIAALADGGIPEYEYLGNNQYRLKTPATTTEKSKTQNPKTQNPGMSGSSLGTMGGTTNPAYTPPTPEFRVFGADKKIMTPEDITATWKKMGGTGEVPADFMKKYSGNKRAEQDIANEMKKLPFFTTKFDAKTGDPTTQATSINNVAKAMLGRDATPEELARLIKSNSNLADVRNFYGKNAKSEYMTYQQKVATTPSEATTDGATTVAPTGATPTQIANIYSNIFGGVPDASKLDYYSNLKMSPEDVKKSLMESEEYKKKLTTPFVAPITYTGSTFSPDAVKTQLGREPSAAELTTAQNAFIPNRATIAGAPEYQTPEQRLGLAPKNALDKTPDFYGMMNKRLGEQAAKLTGAQETFAGGGDINAYSLGGYSDGGRLLRGPGDGVSDSIPASIGDRQPARLADGEFVVPARIVSELGNGSTEAGAKRLYAMMDRIQKARNKTVGKGKVAVNSKADKYLPA